MQSTVPLIKSYTDIPTDEVVWNLINDNGSVHLDTDNQLLMILDFGDKAVGREHALEIAQQHVDYTNTLAPYMETVHILCGLMDKNIRTNQLTQLRNNNMHCVNGIFKPDDLTFRPDDLASTWSDHMNPKAIDGWIFPKQNDSAFSHENYSSLAYTLRSRRKHTAFISGFFADACCGVSAVDACDQGFRVVIDPATVYESDHYSNLMRDELRYMYGNGVIITEPGQIQYVIQKYGTKNSYHS